MKKRIFATVLVAATMIMGTLAGCGGSSDSGSGSSSDASTPSTPSTTEETPAETPAETSGGEGSVYYLNFKPEVAEVWEELAEVYTAETGVEVKVVTAAGGNYETTLKSEIAKKDAPTLFQVNGPVGYEAWKDYCADLSGTDFYNVLSDKELAITGEDGGIYGVPYTIEGYGIIYNDAIMQAYFAMDGAVVTSVDDIKNFDTLKAVTDDMQSKKDDLGIRGVFASTSLLPGEDWRWQTHLANMPFYAEFVDKGVSDLDAIDFTYSENMKNIFDLYITNSTVAPTMLGSKGVNDSMAEFALGQAAMVQNGNWGWGQIDGVDGNTVAAEDVKFLPIYVGLDGEEGLGLCVGTENYFSINSQVSEENQKASIDFVTWLVTSDIGKDYMTNELGNIAPFTTFSADEKPSDPLAKSMLENMESGVTSIPWVFQVFPSQTFKDDFGGALLEYAQGNENWAYVEKLVIDRWAAEKTAQ